MVFWMIHVKDSLLPMVKVWSLDFLGLGSVGYNPKEYPPFISRWNKPLILTIDPNFQRDIDLCTISITIRGSK